MVPKCVYRGWVVAMPWTDRGLVRWDGEAEWEGSGQGRKPIHTFRQKDGGRGGGADQPCYRLQAALLRE